MAIGACLPSYAMGDPDDSVRHNDIVGGVCAALWVPYSLRSSANLFASPRSRMVKEGVRLPYAGIILIECFAWVKGGAPSSERTWDVGNGGVSITLQHRPYAPVQTGCVGSDGPLGWPQDVDFRQCVNVFGNAMTRDAAHIRRPRFGRLFKQVEVSRKVRLSHRDSMRPIIGASPIVPDRRSVASSVRMFCVSRFGAELGEFKCARNAFCRNPNPG